jgi:hypothetical protein
MKLPGMSGIDLLGRLKQATGDAYSVIMITGHGDVPTAVAAMRPVTVNNKTNEPIRIYLTAMPTWNLNAAFSLLKLNTLGFIFAAASLTSDAIALLLVLFNCISLWITYRAGITGSSGEK